MYIYIYVGLLQWGYPKTIQRCLYINGKASGSGSPCMPEANNTMATNHHMTKPFVGIYPILSITWLIVVVPELSYS